MKDKGSLCLFSTLVLLSSIAGADEVSNVRDYGAKGDGLTVSKNFKIEHCTFASRSCNAIHFGSETLADFRNIEVSGQHSIECRIPESQSERSKGIEPLDVIPPGRLREDEDLHEDQCRCNPEHCF